MVVAVIILVGLFSLQHYGTDRVGWLFAPVVLLWFLLVGGIGIYNIWKYDSSVLRAFSPVYIYRYFRREKKRGLDITGRDHAQHYRSFLLALSTLFKHLFCVLLDKSLLARKRSVCALLLIIVWLSISGTEALFADLAHFPVSAIQLAFTVIVFPCLLLTYTGQAAYLMQNKEHVVDAFYRSIPGMSCSLNFNIC